MIYDYSNRKVTNRLGKAASFEKEDWIPCHKFPLASGVQNWAWVPTEASSSMNGSWVKPILLFFLLLFHSGKTHMKLPKYATSCIKYF